MDTDIVILDEIHTALAFLQDGNLKDAITTLETARDYIMSISPHYSNPDDYDDVMRSLGVDYPSDCPIDDDDEDDLNQRYVLQGMG